MQPSNPPPSIKEGDSVTQGIVADGKEVILNSQQPIQMPAEPILDEQIPDNELVPATIYGSGNLLVGVKHRKRIIATLMVVILIVLGGGGFIAFQAFENKNNSPEPLTAISSDKLQGLANQQGGETSELSINSPLYVKGKLIVTPSPPPTTSQAGEIYFNADTKRFVYYDGGSYQTIVNGQEFSQLSAVSRATAGVGLSLVGGVLNNGGVLSLQGQTGNISFSGGRGITLNGTEITNTGVTSVVGTANQIAVSAANGAVQLGLPQDINVTSSPTFSSIILGNALAVNSGGTGSTVSNFNNKGVVYFNGANLVSTGTPASNGLCLISTASGPAFGSCSGTAAVSSVNGLGGAITFAAGSGVAITDNGSDTVTITALAASGVTSLQGLTGALNLANASAGSGIITIDNASTTQKGIASFSSSTFSVSNGAVSLAACSNNQVLKYSTATNAWGCASDIDTDTDTHDGQGVTSITAGDGITVDSSNAAAPTVAIKLQSGMGLALNSSTGLGLLNTCTTGQVLKYNGSQWACDDDIDTDTNTHDGQGITSVEATNASIDINNSDPDAPKLAVRLQANKGIVLDIEDGLGLINCSTDQILKYNASGQWVCASDNDTTGTGDGQGVTAITAGNGITVDSTNTAEPTIAIKLQSGMGLVLNSSTGLGLLNTCSTGQVLKYNGSAWACDDDIDTDTNTQDGQGVTSIEATDASIVVNSSDPAAPKLSVQLQSNKGIELNATTGLGLLSTCDDNQILKYSSSTSSWDCADDADSAGSGMAGSGTTGRLAKFTNSGEVGNSILSEAGDTITLQASGATATLTANTALAVSAGGTNQNLTLNASGSGQVQIGGISTGDILLGGGSGSSGCTVANATGNFACAGNFNTTGQYQINGSQISSAALSNDSNLAKLNADNIFTGTTNTFNSAATTQNVMVVNANTLTSGAALKVTTTSTDLASGSLVDIGQTSAYDSTFTAANKLLNVSRTVTGPPETLAPTFDTTSGATIGYSGQVYDPSELSWSHTVSGGHDDRLLMVSVSVYNTTISTVTYTVGGTSYNLTRIGNVTGNGPFFPIVTTQWIYVGVPTGTGTVKVTGSGTGGKIVAVSSSWYNVDQTDPVAHTYTRTTPGTLTTSAGNKQMVVDAQGYYGDQTSSSDNPPTPGAGQTLLAQPGGTFRAGHRASYKLGAASMTWSGSSYGAQIASVLNGSTVFGATDGTLTGSVANFSSDCSGCTETGNILNLQQSNASATGAVLALQNAGAGADIQLSSGIIRNATDSTTAVRIQNSDGSNTLLSVDTTNNHIKIGDDSGTATALVLDSASTAPTGVNGAMYYDTTDNKFKFYEDDSWVSYSTSSGVTTVGSIDSQTKSADGAVISGTNIYLQTADASNVGLVSTEAQAFAGLKTFNNGLAILQSDTVTNPQAMTITNTAASNSLAILQNGNTGTTASSSGALLINNTGSTGFGLNVYTNQSTPAGALAFFKADHTSFNREVIRVDNDGTGPAIKINANGNTGTGDSTSGALLINNTNNTGFGLNVYSNAATSVGALVRINAANAGFNDPTLYINNSGTSGGAANIRLDGPAPQIEFVETDQDGATGKGKFELEVQGNRFWVNSRNADNTSFETVLSIQQLQSTSCAGCVGIGIAQASTLLQLASDAGTNTSGVSFGTTADTNLYRSAAGVLQTDGDLVVQGNISSPGGPGEYSEKFGLGATVQSYGVAIGNAASGASSSVAIGQAATAGYTGSIAIGQAAITTDSYSIAIGQSATAAYYATAVGYSSVASANYAVALGRAATANANGATALGRSSTASGDSSIALGLSSTASGYKSIALGAYANTDSYTSSIALGYNASNTAANQLVVGSGSAAINDVYIGNGVIGDSTGSFTLQASGASGTDTAGADANFAGGKGTGTGNGGDINLQIAKPGTSSDTLNSLSTVMNLSGANGAATFKNAVDSTTAFQIQSSTGVALLTADTSGMKVTVSSLVVTASLTVNGHIISGGDTPTTTVTAGHIGTVETGASCTISGTDTAGTITINVGMSGGTNPTNICQVNFSSSFGSAPTVVLGAANDTAADQQIMTGTTTTSYFQVNARYYPTGGEVYVIKYIAIQ